jgi:DNA polymerase-3 subunit alpha
MSRHPFVHLHNHTQYSLLDGAQKITDMVEAASSFGMKAVAITDHGNLFGAIKFFNQALHKGIRPILGVEAYVAPGDRRERSVTPGVKKPYYHLVLLAKDLPGYRNLLQLVSAGYREGFYYRPRIDKPLLREHAEGLIALSGCLGGEIATLLRTGREDEAERIALDYADMMGEGNYYLEIQDQGLPEERAINPLLVSLSRKTGLPLVATNDCHFLAREDHSAHDVLLCIQTGKKISDADRMRYTEEHYFKSGEEMEELFHWLPEAVENAGHIADKCHLLLERGEHHLPRFAVPDGQTTEGYFEEVVRQGFGQMGERWMRLAQQGRLRHPLDQYRQRLDAEIRMIQHMGFAGYFLVVWDLIRHARERRIPVGPGRGSAAGSLVAYCMRITDVDPIEHDLIFERFLNPERISMPDIDIDFCFRRRDEVIHYVTEKYGRDNVAQIITFGTMAAKAVIRDVGRALGMPYPDVDRIAKMIPTALDATIDKALAEVEQLRNLYENDGTIHELIDLSRKLEGLTRHASTHAAGVVISPRPIVEFAPLYQSGAESREVTTGYAKDEIEEIGLLKMDFLGLKTLTLIDDTVRMLKETENIDIDIANLPLDDAATYELFAKGQTSGVFQFESGGMRDILRRFKPDQFEDLIALNALYRPGPIKTGMIDDFIRRRHGHVKVEFPHPATEPILRPTYGVIVYQEQVMQIASTLAGYSLGSADLLRKAMGKKKIEVMKANREKFIAGCRGHAQIGEREATKIFELIEGFAGYGFNRSHSAAYALVAYQTANLKAHYPVHFMAALLTSEKGNTDKLVRYASECQREMGIPVLPPDVNVSGMDFSVEGQSVRFGLSAVRNVGEGAVQSILQAREKLGGRFRSIWEFCREIDRRLLNKRVIESLIKAGCLDSLGATRPRLIVSLDAALDRAQKLHEREATGQGSLFAAAGGTGSTEGDDGPLPEADPWSERELLAGERETLGFYLTGHPLAASAQTLGSLTTHTTTSLGGLQGTVEAVLGGLVTAVRKRKNKRGETWASFTLEDLEGTVEVLVFSRIFADHQALLVDDRAVLVQGRAENDGDRTRVLADGIVPLEGARELNAESATLRLPTGGHPTVPCS